LLDASGHAPFDLYVGSGGAPEGVLAACGLQTLGGSFYGRLLFRDDAERERATRLGITDLDRVYGIDDLASDEAVLVLAGVTTQVLNGVEGRAVDVLSISPDEGIVRRTLTL